MDKVTNYRCILRNAVNQYARYQPSHGQIEAIPVCDLKNDNYLLMHTGWDNIRRTHATVLHLRLRDGRVLIEKDGLEHGVTQDLLDAGVAPRDIVYAFETVPQFMLKKAS
jgi:hypothetical protein